MGLLANKKRAKSFYKFFSKFYDRVNPILYSKEMRKLLVSMAEVKPNNVVLEVGCGTGYTTYEIVKIVGCEKTFALDLTSEQIKIAVKKFRSVNFIRGDAELLPFKSSSFDVVISAGSIEYWPNPYKGVKEMVRVTKKNGRIAVLGPRMPDNLFLRLIAPRVMHFFSTKQYIELFEKVGLKDIKYLEIGPHPVLKKLAVIVSGKVA